MEAFPMFSPLNDPSNDPTLADWFRRFDAAARHLPAEDRAAQQEELRQHLDALNAANVASGQSAEMAQQNALTRLGDPSQIGRKIDREWQQSHGGFRTDMKAIGFGVALHIVVLLVIQLMNPLWPGTVYSYWMMLILVYSMAVLCNTVIGRIYPHQAIKASTYSYLFATLLFWVSLVASDTQLLNSDNRHYLWVAIAGSLLKAPWWIIGNVAIAYLASVTRRGWYRPALADFKLSLPRRQAVSRG